MGNRDHYVSQFFLRNFVDPASLSGQSAWLWVGDIAQGTVKRRAPKNIGWSRDLFAGPGGLADRHQMLESHLAQQVEGPAARALRSFIEAPIGHVKEIPPEISRYLSWLAARSLTMKTLYESWANDLGAAPTDSELAEAPPPGLGDGTSAPHRRHSMEHPLHGIRHDVSGEDIEALMKTGWRWRLSNDDFLEMVHVQAWYFQVRFFPRLSWKVLDAPVGASFITCDRPAIWGVDGDWEVPPAALRHSRAELIVPVSGSRAIFGFNPAHDRLGPISPHTINQAIADAAHSWVAGPSEQVVIQALGKRRLQVH